jgi:hypothetical protein
MIEVLKNPDVLAVVIFLGCILAVLVLGCWYISRKTGRPMRDMLSVLAAGITLVILSFPIVVFFDKHGWDSPDRTTRSLVGWAGRGVFLVLALAVWWIFNKLVKSPSSPRKARSRRHSDDVG